MFKGTLVLDLLEVFARTLDPPADKQVLEPTFLHIGP